MICGIDEAGRGPIIGSLVMVGIVIEESSEIKLRELGVKDSKLLTKEVREKLYKEILKIAKNHKISVIEPCTIDSHLKSISSNLNKLEALHTSEILNFLNPHKAIIDLPDRNEAKYRAYIMNRLTNRNINLILEYKADFNYPVVAAASIIAKVTRDNLIEKIKSKIGHDFGSGYMTDEKTAKFLEENWDNPEYDFFRKEWMPWKMLKQSKGQKSLVEY